MTSKFETRKEMLRLSHQKYFAKNKDRFREMNNESAKLCMRRKQMFKVLCRIYTELYEPDDRSEYVERRGRPRKNLIVVNE